MEKTCINCGQTFEITTDDLGFYDKIAPTIGGRKQGIPLPTNCPDCRTQRRMAHRNERRLYHRKCDATGKQIISIYSPDKPYRVYEQHAWWSDEWDALSYVRTIDFSVPFFEQFAQLQREVPRLSIFNQNCENSDYTNQSYDNKNCYLCSAIGDSQDLYYVQNATHLQDSVDASYSQNGELLYECIDTYDSYRSVGLEQCIQCSDSWFLYDCVNCRHCFACVGLRNKEYHIANKPLSKEEYEKQIESYNLGSHRSLDTHKKAFISFLLRFPHVAAWMKQSENVSGNNIRNSRNAINCFDVFDVQDCRHSSWIFKSTDVSDSYGMGKSQLINECIGVEDVTRVCFSSVTSDSRDCFYTDLCFSCTDCFGCIGLRRKEYCILNKQFTKEEYEGLVPKLVAHMQKTGEWGEFFPISLSPFCYNETIAGEYFPLSRENVIRHGWKWQEEQEPAQNYLGPKVDVPDDIRDVSDDICQKILLCEVTGKPYKVIPQELKFYRKLNVPVPTKCPDQRHTERMALRNPRKLCVRSCAKCSKRIEAVYASDRPEIVYCEDCYLKEVY
jgi:hypothetical protein